ncbi:MAG: hypothetical protein HZB39_00380 [Planctomycetes bacterium]|nr:hypothetical protein [Planctomycetota bacterium]
MTSTTLQSLALRVDALEGSVRYWRKMAACSAVTIAGLVLAASLPIGQQQDQPKVLRVDQIEAQLIRCNSLTALDPMTPEARSHLTAFGLAVDFIDKSKEWSGSTATLGIDGIEFAIIAGSRIVKTLGEHTLPAPLERPSKSKIFRVARSNPDGPLSLLFQPTSSVDGEFSIDGREGEWLVAKLGTTDKHVSLSAGSNGTSFVSVQNGEQDVMLGTSNADGATLRIADSYGRTRAVLGGQPLTVDGASRRLPESTLSLWDESGKNLLTLPTR